MKRNHTPNGRNFTACLVGTAFVLAALPADAAKNPDKPDKRIDKIERKMERAAMGDLPSRPAMAAAAPAATPERSSKSERADRPGKSDRADRAERSDRSESSDRSAAFSGADSKFEGFRVITERNIFNPTRIGRSRAAPEEKPPRVDEISLVGTMHYDKGVVAFFDSPDAQYRKNLREGESIAGFKVSRISPDGVELLREDKPVSLKVNQQLRRREGADWSVGATPVRTAPGSVDDAQAAAAAAAQEIPADAPEALKRLMEKRKQQLQK